jgi:hypothetical protein
MPKITVGRPLDERSDTPTKAETERRRVHKRRTLVRY